MDLFFGILYQEIPKIINPVTGIQKSNEAVIILFVVENFLLAVAAII